jgi:hypothetical protein
MRQTRPIDVSEHWSSVLLEEWAKQASLELELNLPVSVIASADAALQAKGQVGFIDLFTRPLFEAASDALPGMSLLVVSLLGRARWFWERSSTRLISYRTPGIRRLVLGQQGALASSIGYLQHSATGEYRAGRPSGDRAVCGRRAVQDIVPTEFA